MRHWTGSALLQIMAYRLFGANPLPTPMLGYCQLDPWEQPSVKYQSKYKIFIHENAFENIVCDTAAILFKVRWFNPSTMLAQCRGQDVFHFSFCFVAVMYVSRWNENVISIKLSSSVGGAWSCYLDNCRYSQWWKFLQNFLVMMTSFNGNFFRVTGHLCGEFIGHQWIPRTKASDADLWCFL